MAELTNNLNFLQPTNFKIIIDRKKYGNLEYFIQNVNHPGVSLPGVEVGYKRAAVHLAGDRLDFEEVTFDIIIDENMDAYVEMYNWLKKLVEEANQTQSQRGLKEPTFADITMMIMSSHNNTTKRIVYRDCIPTSLGGVALTSNATDTTFITLPVTFTFSYFDLV